MSEYIEIIGQLKPKNNQSFALLDANDLKGGYIQVDTIAEMEGFLNTNKLKEGMLCYVKSSTSGIHMFQLIGASWTPWSYTSGGGGGMSLVVVDYLIDLEDPDLLITGQIVYVNEVEELRYYDGNIWKSFSKIYIQDTPPQDKGGIWIDSSEDKQFLNSNQVIQNLLQVISVLEQKVRKLEWAFNSQMDFGNFTNNQYYEYDGQPAVEPVYGTSVEDDVATQSEILASAVFEDVEPVDTKDLLPNGTHLCIKSGTHAEMITNKADFLPKELLWCWDTKELWIKDPRTLNLIKIGSTTGGGTIDDELMEQILTEVIGTGSAAKTKIVGIEFADMTNKNNTYLVNVVDGQLNVHDYRLDLNTLAGNTQTAGVGIYYTTPYFPITSDLVGSTASPKIYINMVYTGDSNDSYSYGGASHNFIELCNLGLTDLNLKGLYLHYTERLSGNWVTLPLKGTLKAGGTFLIRGAQASVRDVNTTILKVDTYDMEWTKDLTLSPNVLEVTADPGAGVVAHSIWDSNNLIRFSTSCAIYLSGAETDTYFTTTTLNTLAPYSNKTCIKWYVDLVGIGTYNSTTLPAEVNPISSTGTNYLHMRYYNMDPVSQATKAFDARDNTKDWISLDLNSLPSEYVGADFTPKASFETKTVFFNKDLLKEGAPEIITCTFGHNAHTTRCFNWISVGYYNEYIQIIQDGGTYTETLGVDMFESFKAGDGRTSTKNWNDSIYDRIREVSTDGTAFTVHKFIKDFTEPTSGSPIIYKYKVGRPGFWSEETSFTLRNRADVIAAGFNFLQVTDEQGFTEEEYEVVNLTSQFILQDKVQNNYSYDFIFQTGDIAQNGNRFNEWLNYFKGRKSLMQTSEMMYIVGNNDLSPVDIHKLGVGDDLSKSNPINVTYFFTFEHPYGVPKTTGGNYIPSVYSFVYGDTYFLAMNSEITDLTVSDVFTQSTDNIYSVTLKTWCENDLLQHASDLNIAWKISLTHEAPFTLLTADLIMSYVNSTTYEVNPTIARGGSHLNTVGNYWYSKFLQDNHFHLNLCGHKHTFTNSRYLRESEVMNETMKPIVYEPQLADAPWYILLPEREKRCCQLSADNTQWYVKYVMSQATGYKLASNKEAPAKNIPWLLEYYPVTTQTENYTTNTATIAINSAQSFPHYILWNIGEGTEVESPTGSTTLRKRIKGNSYKIQKKSTSTSVTWPVFKYSARASVSDLVRAGGNGSANANNNIIIDKLFE